MVESRRGTIMAKYALGLDFGTLDGKAVLVDVKTGEELATAVYNFDISNLEPQVALSHRVDKVVSVLQVAGKPIQQALIGTCIGGRINDIKIAVQILKDRKISPSVRLLIIPASNKILEKCIELGYIQTLLKAGAVLVTPSCGPCLGAHEGVLAPGKNCISTSSRNFPGRMGSTEAKIFLSSPAYRSCLGNKRCNN